MVVSDQAKFRFANLALGQEISTELFRLSSVLDDWNSNLVSSQML